MRRVIPAVYVLFKPNARSLVQRQHRWRKSIHKAGGSGADRFSNISLVVRSHPVKRYDCEFRYQKSVKQNFANVF